MFWSVLLTLLLVAFSLWFLWRKRKFSFFKNLGIPGPEPSIFFGNLYQCFKKNPIVCYKEWIEKYGKVVGIYMGSWPMLMITDLEILKQIQVKESHNFINRPEVLDIGPPRNRRLFDQHIVNLRGKRWKEVRSTMTPAFTSGKMKQMFPVIDKSVSKLLEKVQDRSDKGEEFDICPLFQELTLNSIGNTALGVESNNKTLLETVRMIFELKLQSLIVLFAFSFREFQLFLGYIMIVIIKVTFGKFPFYVLGETCHDVVQERRADPTKRRPDLLQSLIDAESTEQSSSIIDQQLAPTHDMELSKEDKSEKTTKDVTTKTSRLTDDEIVSNALLVLLAGYETTSSTLSFMAHYLVNNLHVQENLQKELDAIFEEEGDIQYSSLNKMVYMDQVFNEVLRICPPIFNFVFRENEYETKISQWTIPANTAVMVPVYYLHNDPDLWPEPNKFDPSRFSAERRDEIQSGSFQAFGMGPRNCIGMRFAMMEAKLAVARLLRKFNLRPSGKTFLGNPDFNFSLVSLSPKAGVYLNAVARKV